MKAQFNYVFPNSPKITKAVIEDISLITCQPPPTKPATHLLHIELKIAQRFKSGNRGLQSDVDLKASLVIHLLETTVKLS